ncbi:AAA family ATPase [Parasphingorhabdus sp.]|uniref:AAA family ATPase n=1 Tax=Parasphingorhabdus sp. TaxID=2709688 RepID=UPI003267EEDB
MTSSHSSMLLGHKQASQIFTQSCARGTLHHAWVLAGPKGLGKASFAKRAAQYLLESDPLSPLTRPDLEVDPSSQAAKLLAARSHPDFRMLQRGGKSDKEEKKARENGVESLDEHELKRNISIAQVRSLQSLFNTQSSISTFRLVIIDAIDDLERGGANALLKNLEEPPENTIFLLVSHAPERLLPTIRSRCQILRFDPLNDDEMRQILSNFDPKLGEADLEALVRAGEGSPGRALQYVSAGLAELEQDAQEIMRTGDRDNKIKNGLARKLSLKAATPRYHAFLDRVPSLIANEVKNRQGPKNIRSIEIWRKASDLAAMAVPKALDNQAVVFQLGSLMGSLALHQQQA